MTLLRPSAALLSRKALASNLKRIRERVSEYSQLHRQDAEVMAVVKANAYGHSLELVMRELEQLKVTRFCVASIEEALEARAASSRAKILVLGGTLQWSKEAIELIKKHRFEVAVHDLQALDVFLGEPEIPIHLKVDTGMNRLGLKSHEWATAIERIKRKRYSLFGLMTHLATSEAPLFEQQMQIFEEVVRWFKSEGIHPAYVHSENSGALFSSHRIKKGILSETQNLVRPGISLYGYYPRGVKPRGDLTPVLELISQVGLVKHVEAGEGISYGHLYKAKTAHRYGVVPLGYADGISKSYASHLSPQWRSSLGKKKGWLSICGAICMDMVMVKTTRGVLEVGDQVVFWGRFDNPMLKSKTIEAYELNLRIAKRIPRLWID